MSHGSNILFNLITLLFLGLTVVVLVIVLAVASDSIEAPILAPEATQPPPTVAPLPTMTPTLGADMLLTPTPGS